MLCHSAVVLHVSLQSALHSCFCKTKQKKKKKEKLCTPLHKFLFHLVIVLLLLTQAHENASSNANVMNGVIFCRNKYNKRVLICVNNRGDETEVLSIFILRSVDGFITSVCDLRITQRDFG